MSFKNGYYHRLGEIAADLVFNLAFSSLKVFLNKVIFEKESSTNAVSDDTVSSGDPHLKTFAESGDTYLKTFAETLKILNSELAPEDMNNVVRDDSSEDKEDE